MTKTVPIPGLKKLLLWLQPVCRAIATNGNVTLQDGVVLEPPDDTTLAFSETDDPQVIRVTFAGMKLLIHQKILAGLFSVNGVEPLKFADVGPESVDTVVSIMRVHLVDGQ